MKKVIDFVDGYGQDFQFTVDNLPTTCPHCGKEVDFSSQYCEYNNDTHKYSFFLKCPFCEEFSLYVINQSFYPIAFYPTPQIVVAAPNNVASISPSFNAIYRQSQLAENYSLTDICGMGYRKALEFLVKDYLISLYPDEKETISKEPLMQSIRRIDHKQIKILAEKIAWLGNDETHYTRKHTDLDLQDLKRFLDKVIKYIDMELTTLEADSIPKK